jgi:hypothetical protein
MLAARKLVHHFSLSAIGARTPAMKYKKQNFKTEIQKSQALLQDLETCFDLEK